MSLARLTFMTATLIAGAMPAAAHPHVFVKARAEIIFDDKGRASAIRNVWQFDEAFSVFATQGMDTDGDGKLSAAGRELDHRSVGRYRCRNEPRHRRPDGVLDQPWEGHRIGAIDRRGVDPVGDLKEGLGASFRTLAGGPIAVSAVEGLKDAGPVEKDVDQTVDVDPVVPCIYLEACY